MAACSCVATKRSHKAGHLIRAPNGAGALAAAGLAVAALRAYCYGQAEYVTAAMLSRNLPKGGSARIIQLGGGTRELFYYPKSTVQV